MNAILDKLREAIPSLLDSVVGWITNLIVDSLMKVYTFALQFTTVPFNDYWGDPLIQAAIRFSQWVAFGVMGISILFMIIDYAEDIAAKSSLSISEMVMNIIKGFVFCLIAPEIGVLSINLGSTMVSTLSFVGLGTDGFTQIGLTGFLASGFLIYSVIMLVIFIFISARQHGFMLIHIMTYALYVPGVVRGDAQSMGAWMRQMVAITITYLCQYFLFYAGLYFAISSKTVIAISCWTAMMGAAKILNKFGLSSGFSGGSQVLSLAGQALRIAT
jgi:hypothetical protein